MVSQKNLQNLKGQRVSMYYKLFLNITLIPKPKKERKKNFRLISLTNTMTKIPYIM